MFGKIIKDINFDAALKSINETHGSSAQFITKSDSIHGAGKVGIVENEKYLCDLNDILPTNNWIGFDESILEYATLEGVFKIVSYALVATVESQYVPAIFLDLSFFSRFCPSNELSSVYINSADSYAFEKHYNKQKYFFIDSLDITEAIVLMDGPLFSGINTQFNFRNDSNIYVHFVKNSNSTQICDTFNYPEFNNDLHWAMNSLRPFERSQVYSFTSEDGRSKVFTYLKLSQKHSPVRIEVNGVNQNILSNHLFWNTICHQYVASGLKNNNQPRLIELAERYAREAINKSQVMSYLARKKLIPTMNEQRF